jgi:Heat induced stress protein YflT
MTPRSTVPDDLTVGTPSRTVVGLFSNRADAEHAIRELRNAGFSDQQIGIAMQDRDEQRQLIDESGSTAAEGAAAGALSGGVVGGLIGLLGSLLIPGVGPIVVGGVLASTLTGAGIGAATGGIIGALMGLGVPEADAQHFDLGLRSGRTLVTVDAGARTGEALGILERHGMDFGPSGRQRYGSFDRATGAAGLAGAGTVGEPTLAGLGSSNIGAIDDGVGGAGGSDAGIGSLPGSGLGGIGSADVASGSSTGTRGFPSSRERYGGRERRARQDPAYSGPERRLAGV